MKKFIVKFKDSGMIFCECSSKKEASDKLMEYIYYFNDCSDGDYISPFDFTLEEAECKEVSKVITDFETARKVLGIKPLEGIIVSKRLEGVERLVREINPKHIEALIALNELFTIAQAWNKADGFAPDFSDWNQNKWYPWFKYDKDAAGFVCANTDSAPTTADATIGSRLCFKSSARADQFGKQFENLYNKVFLINK